MPEPTPEAWAHIRYEYEHTARPVEDICAEHGISSGTLRDRLRRWRWRRRRPPIPRDGPPPVPMTQHDIAPANLWPLGPRLRGDERESPELIRGRCEPGWGDFQTRTDHPTPTVFAGAQTVDPPPPGEGDDRAAAPQPASAANADAGGPASIVQRLQGATARVLPAIEAIIARLAAGPHRPREMEQAGRALGALTRTLRELNALLSQHNAPAGNAYDDMPEDMDAFRDELARRIRVFVSPGATRSMTRTADEAKRGEAKMQET